MITARDFLLRVLPWPRSDDPGYVTLHWWVPNPEQPDPTKEHHKFWSGRPYRAVDDMLGFAAWLMRQPNTRDIYFCTSLQREATINKMGKPKAIRGIDNTLLHKCLFLDIDIKDKGYPTIQAAVAALGEFIVAQQVPAPNALVASGGGLHVYWIHEPLAPDDWQPLADGLAGAAARHGLKCDLQCTVDQVRILRVPQTLNHKFSPPVPVKVLGLS